jgi:HSP20 family protein
MQDDFRKFEEFMNRMFEGFGDVWSTQRGRHLPLLSPETGLTVGSKRPYIDIVESDKEIVATAEMPGMNKEDININLTSGTLELSAETKHEEEKKGEDYVYRERRSGNYYRSISLPSPVDSNSAKASYNNGILEIKMQKKEIKKKTSLKIE